MEPNAFIESQDMPQQPRSAPRAVAAHAAQPMLALPPSALPFETAVKPAGALVAEHAAGGAAMLVTPSPFAQHVALPVSRGTEPETARARLESVLEQAAAQSLEAQPEEAAPQPASRVDSRAEAAAEPPAPHKRKRAVQPAAESPAKRAARARSGQCSGA
jgi:hypothetical protein